MSFEIKYATSDLYEIGAFMVEAGSDFTNVNYSCTADDNSSKISRVMTSDSSGDALGVVSPLDKTNKISEGYINCQGEYGIGFDEDQEAFISFLTHQNPARLEDEKAAAHLRDLIVSRIEELLECCCPGSVKIYGFGGRWDLPDIEKERAQYVRGVNFMNDCARIAGFDHLMIEGGPTPIAKKNRKNFYSQTQAGKALLVRQQSRDEALIKFDEPFKASDVLAQTQELVALNSQVYSCLGGL